MQIMFQNCAPDSRLGRGDETKTDADMSMPLAAINSYVLKHKKD